MKSVWFIIIIQNSIHLVFWTD